jgi:GNAT superfamily N-acetyltransferase
MKCRPVRASDAEALADLFGARGACGGCWCRYWMSGKTEYDRVRAGTGAEAKRLFMAELRKKRAPGVIALDGGEAIGWARVGPKADYVRLESSRKLKRAGRAAAWSIVCFFVRPGLRGQGIGAALLDAACAHAFAQGASEIEAYPVPHPAQGAKVAAVFAWTGLPSMFEAAGFAPDPGSPDPRRPVYVLRKLSDGRTTRRANRRAASS